MLEEVAALNLGPLNSGLTSQAGVLRSYMIDHPSKLMTSVLIAYFPANPGSALYCPFCPAGLTSKWPLTIMGSPRALGNQLERCTPFGMV